MNEHNDLPILTKLEKKIIVVLGQDLSEFDDICRYSSTSIKIGLNEHNQKYQLSYRTSVPYSTLKSLERKQLVDSVYDTENNRAKKFYMLTNLGIQWYHRAKPIEDHIFSQ